MHSAPSTRSTRACVFDAYGTIFDFTSAAARCADVLGDRAAPLAAAWRDKQLAYTWLRAAQGRHADFWQVTGDALDFVMEAEGIADLALRERLLALYRSLDAFPEVHAVLTDLRAAGVETAILSNGTPGMLKDVVTSAKLDALLPTLISVEEVGVFKPHPSVYRRAVDRLQRHAEEIIFVSANAWDAHAASAFGMQVVWCNRYGQRRERLPGAPDHEIRTLTDLVKIATHAVE